MAEEVKYFKVNDNNDKVDATIADATEAEKYLDGKLIETSQLKNGDGEWVWTPVPQEGGKKRRSSKKSKKGGKKSKKSKKGGKKSRKTRKH